MQNPDFLDACIAELEARYGRVEVVKGDRYRPVWAVKLPQFEMPATIQERRVDVTIPLSRCAGYLPGAVLAGLHVSEPLHGTHDGETTVVPFCDPVNDTEWLVKTSRFYPLYDHDPEALIGTSYLCLNNPSDQPETPQALLSICLDYLTHWKDHAFNLAVRHGAIARGDEIGDSENSADWIEHLVEQVSPRLRAKLLAMAYPKDYASGLF